jgi:primosomal protein N' (replication factor Y)
MEPLQPGQRVLIEFGRRRTMGFCLGPANETPGITTKPVLKTLDLHTRFDRELYDLCLWMADYYFANPADCLAAALPPLLKTRRTARLTWAAQLPDAIPETVRTLLKPGKRIPPETLKLLQTISAGGLAGLIDDGIVVEQWAGDSEGGRTIVTGYRVGDFSAWGSFFTRRKLQPQPFDGQCTRAELTEQGWSDHHLREAVKAGLLVPVESERAGSILDFISAKPGVADLVLTTSQQSAVDAVAANLGSGFHSHLLHGITGSGKTLVYCHLARKVLEKGHTVLVLTPEIALSGTTLSYFRGFFGDLVTVMHSAMTQRERMDSWNGMRRGKYRIVVGPRSAVFAPLREIGLVIVDEEHDGSYKQDDPAPRFHGRDSAIMRARINGISVLLGSASPSLESYHNARLGRYKLIELTERPGGATLPTVRTIDMRTERIHGDMPYLSFPLKKEVDLALERDEQVILFLNRRGYSPQVKCSQCGFVPHCPHCEVKLTYHKAGGKLSCHYCGHVRMAYDKCEACGGVSFMYPGAGTQKVEEHIGRLFPTARVLRFDSDTAGGRQNGHRLLHEFSQRQHNLLLGTQMVTKGLDLPGVSLVGVLSADLGLDMPDFRAAEKTFARLLQVAGRCGRGSRPGVTYIQTYYPESEVIADAARQDYVAFFEREILSRQVHGFPPFSRLARFVLSSTDRAILPDVAADFGRQLIERCAASAVAAEVLGPAPCPVAVVRAQARRQLFVKTRQVVALTRMLTQWEGEYSRFGLPAKVKLQVDVDPDDVM